MSQGEPGIELDTSLGYMLKAAASALHSALEAVLRPLGMTITHYACLELLAQRPGLSNSELARGAFVTRQSMNVLLQALEHQDSSSARHGHRSGPGLADRADRPRAPPAQGGQRLSPSYSQSFTARLKSCPDTKHECFPQPVKSCLYKQIQGA